MAEILLPPSLPAPDLKSYAQVKAFNRSDMDSGLARHRRPYKRTPQKGSLRWVFDDEELALFEGWCEYELAIYGAWWRGEVFKTGTGIANVLVRFTNGDQPVTKNPLAYDLTEVTAEVETMDLPILNPADYTAYWMGSDAYVQLIDRLHHAVNVVIPETTEGIVDGNA